MARFVDYDSVKKYLYSLRYHGAKYGIERMEVFSDALGHPERMFPVIHIAGTNGKGSTSAMIEAVFRTAGYKTGLYTSPHLVHQGERIQVNRTITSHEVIVDATNKLCHVADAIAAKTPDLQPSFFEFMTAMAFERFASERVDIGIVEVGLGGRLDATNVVLPELSIITSISLDHCELLGDTVEQIAMEKAGIIKPGVPVVLGHLPPIAEVVIRRIAADRGSEVHTIAEAFGDPESLLPENVQRPECAAIAANYPQTRLEGYYQRWNAATARLACRLLGKKFALPVTAITTGLNTVQWAGRWERRILAEGKHLILDASHNVEGAEMLEHHLGNLEKEIGHKPIVMTGSLGEKRAGALFVTIARHAREIHLLRPAQPRALPFEMMEQLIPSSYQGEIYRSVVRTLFPSPGHCILGAPGETLVATGSIYLIGEIMEALDYALPVAEDTLQ